MASNPLADFAVEYLKNTSRKHNRVAQLRRIVSGEPPDPDLARGLGFQAEQGGAVSEAQQPRAIR